MPKKKVKKYRGSRTCGGGSHKNRRGAGNRGGRGNAGVLKHKYIWAIKTGYEIGKHGFTRPKVVRSEYRALQALRQTLRELRDEGKLDDYTYRYFYSRPEINVEDIDAIIDRLVELGLASKEGEVYELDLSQLGYTKLLGRGVIRKAIQIKVAEATETAVSKVEEAGGKIILEM